MANYWPAANGNWSNLSNWLTATGITAGVLPGPADDVYADNRTVTIDINANVNSVRTTQRTGGTAGGVFNPNNNITLSAVNIIPGTTTCINFLSALPNIFTLVGNISGASSTNIPSVRNNSTGTIFVSGNVEAGPLGTSHGILNQSNGTIFVSGDIFGSRSSTTGHGINNNSFGAINVRGNAFARFGYGISNASGVVSVSGNVVGGTVTSSYGIYNPDTGVVTIYGNVSGGNASFTTAVQNAQGGGGGTITVYGDVYGGTGTGATGINNIGRLSYIYVYGNVFGGTGSDSAGLANNASTTAPFYIFVQGNVYGGLGSNAFGVTNAPGGLVQIKGTAVGNGFGLNSTAAGISQSVPGIRGFQTAVTIVESISCGSRGQWPTTGNIFISPQSTSTVTLFTSALSAGPSTVLFTSLSTNIVPPASSVRLGTVYNLNQSTGTCVIPSVSSVLQGASVDSSVGIAALQPQTIWDYSALSATDVDSLGGRLANVATVQSVGQQLTALN